MLRKYILTIFVFTISLSFAQQKEIGGRQIVPHIRIKAGIKKNEIALRWAVDEPIAWQKANKIGFNLKRYTLSRDGKLLHLPEEKDLGIFMPKPEKEWMPIIEKNDNAAIVAQSLFGESFEVEIGEQKDKLQGIMNKSQELDQRFAFALMAADLDFKVAELAGWGYVDRDVKPGEKYLYSISINLKNNALTPLLVEKGDAIASLEDYQLLPQPLDFIGIFQDKTVTLSWSYLQLRDIYTSYYIEKSENGTDFKSLGDLPVMNMNDKDDKPAQGMVYIDSLAQNNKNYAYRIRGKNIFGEYGPYSQIVSGMGIKALENAPRIVNFNIQNNEDITLNWEFSTDAEKDIIGFELIHSETDEQNSYKTINNKIPASARSITTKSSAPSNYYKIKAVGRNGAKRESFAMLVQPEDNEPPAIPKGFKGKIDSLGVVHLEWLPNIEKDLEGYHIFRGVQKGEEMLRLTPQAISENRFEDKVILENLNSKVYYYVISMDKRKNQSEPSQIIELEKPDKVKPMMPVFTDYKLEENGNITLNWMRSHSDDVEVHQLYRQALDSQDKEWHKIFETKDLKETYTYTDKDVENEKRYRYYLMAIDKSQLKSDHSQEITLRSNNMLPMEAINNLTPSVDHTSHKIEINWKIKADNIEEIVVYRQKGNEKPMMWGTLNGNQNFLEDKNVAVGNTYTYLIKPMLINNRVAKTEKITIEF